MDWNNFLVKGQDEEVEDFLWNADIGSVIFTMDPTVLKNSLFGCMVKFPDNASIQNRCLQLLQDCHILTAKGITNEELTTKFDILISTLAKWLPNIDVVLNLMQLLAMIADREIIRVRCCKVEDTEILPYLEKAMRIHLHARPVQHSGLQLFEEILKNSQNEQNTTMILKKVLQLVLDNLLLNITDPAICHSSFAILSTLAEKKLELLLPWLDHIINLTMNTIANLYSAEVVFKCLLLLEKLAADDNNLVIIAAHERGLMALCDGLGLLTPKQLNAALILLRILHRALEDVKVTTILSEHPEVKDPFLDLLQSELSLKFDKYLNHCQEYLSSITPTEADDEQMEDYFLLYHRILDTIDILKNGEHDDDEDQEVEDAQSEVVSASAASGAPVVAVSATRFYARGVKTKSEQKTTNTTAAPPRPRTPSTSSSESEREEQQHHHQQQVAVPEPPEESDVDDDDDRVNDVLNEVSEDDDDDSDVEERGHNGKNTKPLVNSQIYHGTPVDVVEAVPTAAAAEYEEQEEPEDDAEREDDVQDDSETSEQPQHYEEDEVEEQHESDGSHYGEIVEEDSDDYVEEAAADDLHYNGVLESHDDDNDEDEYVSPENHNDESETVDDASDDSYRQQQQQQQQYHDENVDDAEVGPSESVEAQVEYDSDNEEQHRHHTAVIEEVEDFEPPTVVPVEVNKEVDEYMEYLRGLQVEVGKPAVSDVEDDDDDDYDHKHSHHHQSSSVVATPLVEKDIPVKRTPVAAQVVDAVPITTVVQPTQPTTATANAPAAAPSMVSSRVTEPKPVTTTTTTAKRQEETKQPALTERKQSSSTVTSAPPIVVEESKTKKDKKSDTKTDSAEIPTPQKKSSIASAASSGVVVVSKASTTSSSLKKIKGASPPAAPKQQQHTQPVKSIRSSSTTTSTAAAASSASAAVERQQASSQPTRQSPPAVAAPAVVQPKLSPKTAQTSADRQAKQQQQHQTSRSASGSKSNQYLDVSNSQLLNFGEESFVNQEEVIDQLISRNENSQLQAEAALRKADEMHKLFVDAAKRIEEMVTENDTLWHRLKVEEEFKYRVSLSTSSEDHYDSAAPHSLRHSSGRGGGHSGVHNANQTVEELYASFPPKNHTQQEVSYTDTTNARGAATSPVSAHYTSPQLKAKLKYRRLRLNKNNVNNNNLNNTNTSAMTMDELNTTVDEELSVVDKCKQSLAYAGTIEALDQIELSGRFHNDSAPRSPQTTESIFDGQYRQILDLYVVQINEVFLHAKQFAHEVKVSLSESSLEQQQQNIISLRSLRTLLKHVGVVDGVDLKTHDMEIIISSLQVRTISPFGVAYALIMCGHKRFKGSLSGVQLIATLNDILSSYLQHLDAIEEAETNAAKDISPAGSRKSHTTSSTSRGSDGGNKIPLMSSEELTSVLQLLEKEKKALITIYEAYASRIPPPTSSFNSIEAFNNSIGSSTPRSRFHHKLATIKLSDNSFTLGLSLENVISFSKDFQVTPELVSRVQLVKIFNTVAASNTNSNNNSNGTARATGASNAATATITFLQFLDLIVLIATCCPIFNGTNPPLVKVSNFLMLLNQSNGKEKIADKSRSSSLVVFRVNPAADVFAPPSTSRSRGSASPFPVTTTTQSNSVGFESPSVRSTGGGAGGGSVSSGSSKYSGKNKINMDLLSPTKVLMPVSKPYYDSASHSIVQGRRKKHVSELHSLLSKGK